MVQVTAKSESSMQRREDASTLHERLVAYVHAISDTQEARTGVWMEHSYARARGSLPADTAPRVLLGARALPAPEEPLDVERLDPPAPALSPPTSVSPSPTDPSDADSDTEEEGWEARVVVLAPTAVHARLIGRVLETLRAQRLARLAADGCSTSRREAARTAARRLRSAFAPHWAGPTRASYWAGSTHVLQWVHATLSEHLPRRLKPQYEEAIAELGRAVPRLTERLGIARSPRATSPARDCDASGPWLAWVSDERWERRLAALVPTRALPWPESASGAPESWCAAVAAAMRSALADVLAEAGNRGVVVGGAGAGAALGVWLASSATGAGALGARVRGLVLVGPALETAEGARDSPEDPLREVRVPVLAVCGAGGGGSRARALFGGKAGRRLVEVRGADGALRVWRGVRRRARVTQEALDATVAEECARWVQEVAEEEPEPTRTRRYVLPESHQKIFHTSEEAQGAGAGAGAEAGGAALLTKTRSIEIAEGRVVSRGSGSTPLALPPPRRAACGSPGAAGGTRLAPADIMQMPIVFADDARAPPAPAPAPATPAQAQESATASARYPRVLVAKRAAVAGAGTGARERGASSEDAPGGSCRGRAGGAGRVHKRVVKTIDNMSQ